MAMRDEIVKLVQSTQPAPAERPERPAPAPPPAAELAVEPAAGALAPIAPPKTGVEIVQSEERNGAWYHSMRDLRNGTFVYGSRPASN
jgi:hypothetical protein